MCEEVSQIIDTIQQESGKPQKKVIIVSIRSNLNTLEAISKHEIDAFSPVSRQLLTDFICECQRLYPLFPILREIDDPLNSEIIADGALPEGERFASKISEVLTSPTAEAVIGPSIPAATRDIAAYPWDSRKQRIIGLASFSRRVLNALNNLPKWLEGTAKYAEMLKKVAEAYAIVSGLFR